MVRVLSLVLFVLAVAGGAAAADEQPARILFQTFPYKTLGTPYGLGLANADGTDFVDLTESLVRDRHAALEATWAPDGSTIAFTLYRRKPYSSLTEAAEIYLLEAGAVRRLTFDAEGGILNVEPAWSPDGSRIAWLKRIGRGSDVWAMNADGSGQRAITVDGADGAGNTNVRWSADGRYVAWLKRIGEASANVWLANADGSGARALTTSSLVVRGPIWQPGGRLLLYGEGVRMKELHVVDPAVGPPGVVISSTGDADAAWDPHGSDPAWSPSGTRIAFGHSAGVEVATLDGLTRRVTKTDAYRVVWSPDESKLAFVHEQWVSVGRSICACANVYVVDVDGGHERIVTGREGVPDISWFEPLWWPDSARLSVGGEWGIVNVNADGTCLRTFPSRSGTSISGPLLWEPGGATLPPLPRCVTLEATAGFRRDTAPVGAPPQVDLTIQNRGNDVADALMLVVTPSSGTVDSDTLGCDGGRALRCTLGSLPGLSSKRVEIDVSRAKPGTFTLALTISAKEQKPLRVEPTVELLPCARAGTDAPNVIEGSARRDTICGFDGDDRIDGLGGNDWLHAGLAHDLVHGGDGNDVIIGDVGHDRLYGEAGADMIDGGNGPDRIFGGPGNDRLTGGIYPDRLLGGPGNDTIDALDGYADYVDCGPGNDTVVTGYRLDRIKNCERVITRG